MLHHNINERISVQVLSRSALHKTLPRRRAKSTDFTWPCGGCLENSKNSGQQRSNSDGHQQHQAFTIGCECLTWQQHFKRLIDTHARHVLYFQCNAWLVAVLQGTNHCCRRIWTEACATRAYRTYFSGCVDRASRIAWQWGYVPQISAFTLPIASNSTALKQGLIRPYQRRWILVTSFHCNWIQLNCRGDWIARRPRGCRMCCLSTKWIPQSNPTN